MQLSIKWEEASAEDRLQLQNVVRSMLDSFDKARRRHPQASTTWDQRLVIQSAPRTYGSVSAIAKHFGIARATVRKWQSRESAHDRRPGPQAGKSRVISDEEKTEILRYYVERKASNPTLDEALGTLRQVIPQLTRTTLFRIRKDLPLNEEFVVSLPEHASVL